MKSVLVIAAHPDDELLGCAGTIARHVGEGDLVRTIIVAEGATSRSAADEAGSHGEELDVLRRAARAAAEILGVQTVDFLMMPDNRLDSIALLDVIKPIEELIERYDPQIIYTHHIGDVNIDHSIVHRAVFTACRPLPSSTVERILSFETPSSTEWLPSGSGPTFQPNVFIDVSRYVDVKLRALSVYESEMREWPHPRSLRGVADLAGWRGASAGLEAAEAFMLLREVKRIA